VLVKSLFALSHLLFKRGLGWMNDSTAFRFPAFVLSGLLSWALVWLARPFGRSVAVLTPLLFWAVPRHFFHGHLACFDMPVVLTWCLFFLAYSRALETRKGAWKAGAAFGLALATKHNAFFLPFAVVAHWVVTDWRDLKIVGWRGFLGRVPKPMWWMALLGPVILYLHWPYLWHHPIDRINWWLSFHRSHVHYPWQYLGQVLRGPPFPVLYPVTLEVLTVPAATLVAMALGVLMALARGGARWFGRLRELVGEATSREWLLLFGGVVAIAPFMLTVVPIFGGVKHWMAAMAVACLFGAMAITWIARQLVTSKRAALAGALGLLVLAPGAWATAHFHPYGTSAYNEIAGGAAGGAALGMQRQYWSNNVTAVLDWINVNAPQRALVYFHEVNWESFQAYQANGYLRKDIRYAQGPRDAAIVAYQYHQEFRNQEFEVWSEFGTRVPAVSFAIDEATQIVVYVRPGVRLGGVTLPPGLHRLSP
jgi:hypothetical protein